MDLRLGKAKGAQYLASVAETFLVAEPKECRSTLSSALVGPITLSKRETADNRPAQVSDAFLLLIGKRQPSFR